MLSLKDYLWDKIGMLFVSGFGLVIMILFLNIFKVDSSLKIVLVIIYSFVLIVNGTYDYLRKVQFYNTLTKTLTGLDKKYLVTEMLNKPNFLEGKIFYQALYEINKAYLEELKKYSLSVSDFKDYVEMWIHEVKIPISSLVLLNHNHQGKIAKKYEPQIRKLDNYIDQILYYVRSENMEKDYMIKERYLKDIIHNVALKNKDDLLLNNISLEVIVHNEKVLTDSKWLEFILNQIINNAIKYRKDPQDLKKDEVSLIKITAIEDKKKVILNIYDNGIGITKSDLPRVFEKSFTGANGRGLVKSTGMGLYIAKRLCTKLDHNLRISSVKDEYTILTITFFKNDYYKMEEI